MNRRDFLARFPALAALPLAGGGASGPLFPMSAEGASPTAPAATNTAAFYRALARARDAGGDVQVDGRYAVSNLILDGQHEAGIVGLGRARSALIGGTGDNALLSVVRSDRVRVSGLELVTQGVAAVYGLTSAGLTLSDVQTSGGRMAGLFLDRCPAPVLAGVTVRDVTMNGAIGGAGVWLMRGGTSARISNLTVERVDGDGVRLDCSSSDGLPPGAVSDVAIMGLWVADAGRVATNAAALLLEGATHATVSSVQIAGVRGHGIVFQQDQSGIVPEHSIVSGMVFRALTGYAVAYVGARNNAVVSGVWDGSGAGLTLTLPGLGGSGAASERNHTEISGPGR